MKGIFCSVFIGIVCVAPLWAESFLTAQSFPKTFEDLSFVDRLEIIKDGYEPYAAEYDENGFCVKNCTYPGLNIKQEEYIAQQDTENALQQSEQYQENVAPADFAVSTIVNSVSNNTACIKRKSDIPTGQKVPKGEPLIGNPRITSKFGPRVLNGMQGFHDGIDYAAPIGTPVYSPADGYVVSAGTSGRCGNMVIIQHSDGIKTIYCHLSNIYVKSGQHIDAGCSFAATGNTGHSTGPHLHYAMKNSEGRKINPAAYTGRDGN